MPDTVVVALPRGGVVPAYVVATELHQPLEVVMVKKLGHPSHPELAIGAVSLRNRVLDEHLSFDDDYLEAKTQEIREMLKKRYEMYRGQKKPLDLRNKTVIVVDDGVATGNTMVAALQLIRSEKPRQVIVAVPVAPTRVIERLRQNADRVLCLETHSDFFAIGLYYKDFGQVSDDEVKRLLEKAVAPLPRTH